MNSRGSARAAAAFRRIGAVLRSDAAPPQGCLGGALPDASLEGDRPAACRAAGIDPAIAPFTPDLPSLPVYSPLR